MKTEIDIHYLREKLRYDPESGKLFWNSSRRGRRVDPSKGAGCVNSEGYVVLTIRKRQVRAHRVVWAIIHGCWPSGEIDHVNGVKTDNRIENLRDVSNHLNQANCRSRGGLSDHKGVGFHSAKGLWRARIRSSGKRLELGYFRSEEAAAEAYREASLRLHGECSVFCRPENS